MYIDWQSETETYSNGLVLVRIQNKHKNIRKEVIILKCLSTTEEKIVGIVVLKSSPRMQQKKMIGSIKEMLKDIQISLRRHNIYLIRVRAREIGRLVQGWGEAIFKEMIPENFLELINDTNFSDLKNTEYLKKDKS